MDCIADTCFTGDESVKGNGRDETALQEGGKRRKN